MNPTESPAFPQRRSTLHSGAGVIWGDVPAGPGKTVAVPRSYGDPAAEYDAARKSVVVVDRAERGLLRVFGRDPVKMVQGLVSNDVEALGPGDSAYALMLTPKGRILADLRVIRRESDLLLEADVAALPAISDNVAHYVPPLFARSEDAGDAFAVIGVYGPESQDIINTAVESVALHGLMPTDYAGVPGTDLVVPASGHAGAWSALVAAGARPAGLAALDVLRIEAGTPHWGAELDETVIPLEAGLGDRAISSTKGCYTGQEVIVRIRDRGHVNRHLRGLLLGGHAAPRRGAELFRPGEPKPVGRVTSSCLSPRLEQTIALAYVRREVEPGTMLRLGDPEGGEARVTALPFIASEVSPVS